MFVYLTSTELDSAVFSDAHTNSRCGLDSLPIRSQHQLGRLFPSSLACKQVISILSVFFCCRCDLASTFFKHLCRCNVLRELKKFDRKQLIAWRPEERARANNFVDFCGPNLEISFLIDIPRIENTQKSATTCYRFNSDSIQVRPPPLSAHISFLCDCNRAKI